MQFVDRFLKCSDCNQDFVFTAGEQIFFFDKQFKNDPKALQAVSGQAGQGWANRVKARHPDQASVLTDQRRARSARLVESRRRSRSNPQQGSTGALPLLFPSPAAVPPAVAAVAAMDSPRGTSSRYRDSRRGRPRQPVSCRLHTRCLLMLFCGDYGVDCTSPRLQR